MQNTSSTNRDGSHEQKRSWKSRWLAPVGVTAALACLIGGGIALAAAVGTETVDITDVPVATYADQNKPNVMLLLDTSESMKWTHMPDEWEGNATTYFPMGYKSALCNTLYYNPNSTYSLPKASDGSDMPQPVFTAAWKDGYDTTLGTVDLSTSFQAYDGDTRRRNFYNDKAQPAYTFEWVANTTVAGRPAPHFEDSTETTGACNKTGINSIQVDDGSLQQSPAIAGVAASGSTPASPAGYWVRTVIPAAQQQNFAIWYSYYRTRINMAKSSVGLAFSPLSDNFRVGFLTVAKPDPGNSNNQYAKFVPLKDFGGTDKVQWFSAIQNIKTGGTSPAREALARVGRYYAGKSDSINDTMTPFVDPVVSACQRHYTIVTTDGYWNVGQETSGPVQIDGSTLVGQQDGPPLALTGADGLIPRPIYDGSSSGYKFVRDATVTYTTAPCTIGWKVTTPAAGTKTETIYKKVVEKDVMTKKQLIADFTWWKKSTAQQTRTYSKVLEWNFPKSERPYWYAQSTGTVTKNSYQQQILFSYINKNQYRYKATSTWSTQTQTPYTKAVASKVEQKKYFYWYRNPAQGETDLKTRNRSVCQAFPSGCTLEGNDTWAVVQSCTGTPGNSGDAQGYQVDCQTSEVAVDYASYCPASNGQFVAGVGTIQCAGSSVPAYSGPVQSCGVIDPNLKAAIIAAGGDYTKVIYSNCVSTNSSISYVTADQCSNSSGNATNGYKSTTCAKTDITNVTDNSCAITTAPILNGGANNQYTECAKVTSSTWVAQCAAGPLPDQGTQLERTCVARGAPKLTSQVAPNACTNGVSGSYYVECTGSSVTWSGPVQQGSASCVNNAAAGKACVLRYGGYTANSACVPKAPTAETGWVGTECADASQGTCTPAAGTENNPVPASGAVALGSCVGQAPEAANGCIQVACNTAYTGPTKVATCANSAGTAAPFLQVSCVAANEPSTPVASCTGNGSNSSNCRNFDQTQDMAYGTCDAALAGVLGGPNPVAVNNYTTSSCSKVDASTAGGLTYFQTAADYAQCQSGTDSNGVKTTCTKTVTTVNVPEGQLCVPGYDPATNKVTDCTGIGQGNTVVVPTKPANCPAATCQEYLGNKKVFTGTAFTNKINLIGTVSTGVPTLVNPPGNVPFSGDLESPAVCYPPEQLSAGAVLAQPADGRPQPGTAAWAALPASHQACTKLPCEQVMESNIVGGSSNSLADVAQYYYATDLRPGNASSTPRGWDDLVKPAGTGAEDDKAKWQHMATYVIGMGVSGTLKFDKDYKNGAGDFADLRTGAKSWPVWPPSSGTSNYEQPQSIDDFWHTAVNGRGRYFSANDPKSIETGLGQVFADIRAAIGSGAGVAISSAVVQADNNFAYGALYRSGSWTGDMLAYAIDVTSGLRTQIANWSAKDRLDSRNLSTDERTIYYMDGASLKPFKWANLGALQSNFVGATAESKMAQVGQMSAAQKSAAMGQKLVDFLRGDRTAEGYVKNDLNKLYRTRDSRLGDIIGSQPLFVNRPMRQYKDEGYATYKGTAQNRKPMVYVGGNDGMLHAFYAEADLSKTTTVGGVTVPIAAREAWAFVPTAVMPEMPRLASTEYESSHRYFVDGSPVQADIKVGNVWKTILVGGFNKGGKGYYALDISDPEAPVGLWQTNIATMGQSYGRPLVSKLPDGTWAVFLTSGYNNSDGVGRVYVLNASTGAVIQTITTSGSGLKELNNFVKDPSGDNTTNLLYGGDILGNIWRFQWNTGSSSFDVHKVVQLTDSGGKPQPITTRVELVQGQSGTTLPRILVATGKLLGVGDLSTTDKQTIYGFDDQVASFGSGSSLRSTLKVSKLKDVTAANGTVLSRTLQCTSATNDCKDNAKGWYIDLPTTGERVNVDLRIAASTLVVASNIPSNEPCVSGGMGWINYINFQTGGPVNEGPGGEGPAGVPVTDGLIMGNDLSATKDGNVTSHVSPSAYPDKPKDIPIPTTTPKPKGKRMSWRELINQ